MIFDDWLFNMIIWELLTDPFDEEEPVETSKTVSEEVIWSGSSGGTDSDL